MPMREERTPFDDEFLQRLERLHLVSKRIAARGPAGLRRSKRMGDGLEFADHRPYAPGDDVRFIDWPYYARMERLFLRLFHEHSEAGVAILLDTSASMDCGGSGKFAYALRAAAALAYVAMGAFERVTIQPFADRLARPMQTGRNRSLILQVLEFLAPLRPAGRTDLPECIEQFIRTRTLAGTVVLISDLLECEETLDRALALLAGRSCEVTVLHIHSPEDSRPDLAGAVTLENVENGRTVDMLADEKLLDSYRSQWAMFVHRCEECCLSRRAIYVPATTDEPFEMLILETLRKAGVLSG